MSISERVVNRHREISAYEKLRLEKVELRSEREKTVSFSIPLIIGPGSQYAPSSKSILRVKKIMPDEQDIPSWWRPNMPKLEDIGWLEVGRNPLFDKAIVYQMVRKEATKAGRAFLVDLQKFTFIQLKMLLDLSRNEAFITEMGAFCPVLTSDALKAVQDALSTVYNTPSLTRTLSESIRFLSNVLPIAFSGSK